MNADPFSPHMVAVAKDCWGEPNPRLSSRSEIRWGTNGSRSVDLEKGVWHDHETGVGGGVLDLLRLERKLVNGAALDHLREIYGADVGRPLERAAPKPAGKIVATYDYADEDGEVLVQVVRLDPKEFRQRRPDPAGGWSWSVKGVRAIPYRLPELWGLEGKGTAYVVEGEKDADALFGLGLVATCNAGGAGKWTDDHSRQLAGLDVVVLPDNDDAGRKHAEIVAASLQGVAKSVRVVSLPGLPPKGDVSDWLASGGSVAALEAAAASAPQWLPTPPQSVFGAILWSDMDRVAVSEDWAVDDVLHRGDVALVYGASMSGKSFLVLDMALSVARGVPWFGKRVKAGGVIYQAGEGGKGLLKRMRAYRQHHEVADRLPFVLLPARVNLWSADGDADALVEEITAYAAWMADPLQLVVIDTLATASAGANENRSEDVSVLLANGERIRDATGAAVLWVHHKNAGGEKPRGHTSLLANVDASIEVNRSEENQSERSFRIAKVKDGEDGEEFGFQLQPVTIGARDDGKLITSCVVCPAQVGSSQAGSGTERKPRLPAGQLNTLKVIDTALDQYGAVTPSPTGGVTRVTAVEWRYVAMINKTVRGVTLDDNALRQALHRDGEALLAKGLIGRENSLVWITQKGENLMRALG